MNSGTPPESVCMAAEAVGMKASLSRRGFLLVSAGAVCGLTLAGLRDALGSQGPLVIMDNAQGMILADPSRCVGCQRCELACAEFNDGRAQPSLARIKIDRAMNFGLDGPTGGTFMQGTWGNGLVSQGVCRQCPHPVPCEMACPQDAISDDAKTGARVVDEKLCIGCRLCQRACPWNMMVFDEEREKASKCFLCHGKPKCVEACPSGALAYARWRDTTREGRPGGPRLAIVSDAKAKACLDCHAPARKNSSPR